MFTTFLIIAIPLGAAATIGSIAFALYALFGRKENWIHTNKIDG